MRSSAFRMSRVLSTISSVWPRRRAPTGSTHRPGELHSNAVYEHHCVMIRDMRPVAEHMSLDREGFALVTHPSAVRGGAGGYREGSSWDEERSSERARSVDRAFILLGSRDTEA